MKKKGLHVTLIIGIIMIAIAGYLYFRGEDNSGKKEAGTSDTNTAEEKTTEAAQSMNAEENTTASDNEINKGLTIDTDSTENVATTEKKKELPDDYVWDTARLGEPPQIVYDFAENQERLESIMKEAEGMISKGNGFSTGYTNSRTIYYYSGGKDIKDKISKQMRDDINIILGKTDFYELTKDKGGYWMIHYNQEENRDRFIFIMAYIPGMTDEQAYEEDFHRVVGDWFFGTIWKI